MIKKLVIEQFVIIERLEVDFQSGLTVLTGETGAGKSILLDAMGLILGDPPNPAAIRAESAQSMLEAVYAPPAGNGVWKFLSEHGIAEPAQQEFRIRRVTHEDGSEEMEINGKPVDLDFLRKTGAFLCEIHGQHANQSLLDPSNQLNLLDLSAGFPPEILKNVADALHEFRRYSQEKEEETTFFNRNIQNLSKMEQMVKKFNAAGLEDRDLPDIEAEYFRLLTAHQSSSAFQEIRAHLLASNGAVKSLTAACMVIEKEENLEKEKLGNLKTFLDAALENARSALNETTRLSPEYDIDTTPLRKHKDMLDALAKLAQDAEIRFEDVQKYYASLCAQTERLRNGRKRIAHLTQMVQKSDLAYRHHAHILTEKRIEAGNRLSESINALLPPLKLIGAEFKVVVEEKPNEPWTERGFNTVTFKARMNPGQPFSSIAETASGGELARLVLALKVVLQTIQLIPTLIFDEVDTGIGGAAAAAVGEKIAQLAETTQVLVITHSPQVTSRGDQHFHVSKKTDGITTSSVVRTLSLEERIDEVSRMLAGDTITPESRAAAEKLIEEAKNAAQTRRQKIPA